MKPTSKDQVRVLTLCQGEDKTNDLFRLRKGFFIQFVLSSELTWRNVRFFSNYSFDENNRFRRNGYQEFSWIYSTPSESKFDDSNRYILIQCQLSGTFHYYFTIDQTSSVNIHFDSKINNMNGQGYFQIEQDLIYSQQNDDILRQNSFVCQTILSKCLGPFEQWSTRLEVTRQTQYNLIHFTPMEQLNSKSNSSYSIRDHHQINSLLNTNHSSIRDFLQTMKQQWKIFSISDLVYNHVAIDCQLINDYPQCTYNLINSPHLRPSVLLDRILIQFTDDMDQNRLLSHGISNPFKENQFQLIQSYLHEKINEYQLFEYYLIDRKQILKEFHEHLISKYSFLSNETFGIIDKTQFNDHLQVEHGNYQRWKSRIDFNCAEKIYFQSNFIHSHIEHSIEQAVENLNKFLLEFNNAMKKKIDEDIHCAIENSLSLYKHNFLSNDGPKYSRISYPDQPFVPSYFKYPNEEILDLDRIKDLIENNLEYQTYLMAHHGWIEKYQCTEDFADDRENQVFLRREFIPWSDSIKLRYGKRREHCPNVLYQYMKKYTELIAKTFDGCRLDNCHSTEIWFAQEMMDYAREINPNFYINAELFTGDIRKDIYFINQIGIHSLVRESFRASDPNHLLEMSLLFSDSDLIGSFLQSNICPIKSTKPFSWFYDLTHDNPSLIEIRSVEDLLSRSALISMMDCAIGSTRGYDELIPHQIDVVHENRFYSQWGLKEKEINQSTGIINIKRALNKFHIDLNQQGFTQLSIEQSGRSVLIIKRFNPRTNQTVLLVSHQSFYQSNEKWDYISPLSIEGNIDEILLEATIEHNLSVESIKNFIKSNELINGLKAIKIYFRENLSIEESRCMILQSPNSPDYTGYRTVEFTDQFRPGSIVLLQISPLPQIRQSLLDLQYNISQYENPTSSFHQLINQLTLVDLNRILYRSSLEEQADGYGFDVYVVPNYGPMVYCGLQGQMSILEKLRLRNHLDHPLIENLKQGFWLFDYISNRLLIHSNTNQLGRWLKNSFDQLKCLPNPLIPVYFDLLITGAYTVLIDYCWSKFNDFIRQSSTFIRALALTSVQLLGIVENARLPLLSPNLRNPRPLEKIDSLTYEFLHQYPSLASGLPYFSSGIWRNWSRETFISLRGLLLLTGRYDEARFLILAYGQYLRHGLIPNFIADGKLTRYNSRDCVWWWIYSIINYTNIVPNGYLILSDQLLRFYPNDDCPIQTTESNEQQLFDLIQEVLNRHAQTIEYRERGAGYSLDCFMTDQGFHNSIGIDRKTGFPYGGNQWNCGTWMDKMGSSVRAGNKGHPATPRDGSAIELVAFFRTTLNWLIQMNQLGFYPYDSFLLVSGQSDELKYWKFIDCLKLIDISFENEFWIDQNNSSEYVNRRSIYKDTVNSSMKWSDFQFRPNFLIAAVVAPEMFDMNHLRQSLEQARKILLGKYGMKTLDPSDLNYIGSYNPNEDSDDYRSAQGFNYHNGPEWLWLIGYYIRVQLYCSKKTNNSILLEETKKHLGEILSHSMQLLLSNNWKGLPGLTNTDGQFCPYSCSVQASSSATILEALFDLKQS